MKQLYTPEQWVMERFLNSQKEVEELKSDNEYLRAQISSNEAKKEQMNYATINLQDEVAISYQVGYLWDKSSLKTQESKDYFTIDKVKELIATKDMELLYESSQIKISDSSYSDNQIITHHKKKFDFVFEFDGEKLAIEYVNYSNSDDSLSASRYDSGSYRDYNPISRDIEMRNLALEEYRDKLKKLLVSLEKEEEE